MLSFHFGGASGLALKAKTLENLMTCHPLTKQMTHSLHIGLQPVGSQLNPAAHPVGWIIHEEAAPCNECGLQARI